MVLKSVEKKLQILMESSIDRLFYPGMSQNLSNQLVTMIEAKMETETNGKKVAPDLIDIYISPEKWDAWQESLSTLQEVTIQIEKSWLEEGFTFRAQPHIRLIPSAELDINEVRILTGFSKEQTKINKTAVLEVPKVSTGEIIPQGAYLIIDGKDHIPLDKLVINIGRRSTNDIVLKDPMVSREHLQLRAQDGRYLLFDLSSTGGTYINYKACRTATLKPGDVIRIGKTILIFNQDVPELTSGTRAVLMD